MGYREYEGERGKNEEVDLSGRRMGGKGRGRAGRKDLVSMMFEEAIKEIFLMNFLHILSILLHMYIHIHAHIQSLNYLS